MTEHKAGQRVRIEYPDHRGHPAEEGLVIFRNAHLVVDLPDTYRHLDLLPKSCTVTVLSEPRPDEPTGLGAVVEASEDTGCPRKRFVRVDHLWRWEHVPGSAWAWAELVDPVVLSEGWTPDD